MQAQSSILHILRLSMLYQSYLQTTLPKLNPLGLKKRLRLRENLTSLYVGSKAKENKDKGACIGLLLRRIFHLNVNST